VATQPPASGPSLTPPGNYKNAFAITPSDTVTFTSPVPQALHVGTSGSLVVDMVGSGTSITLNSCSAGFVYPYAVTKVHAASSASIGLVGLY
jgi:hypothetical protein